MSEEVKVKMSIPMFQEGELETFDNNIHSIIEEYAKIQLHEKEQILTQRIIIKQEEEIRELQNQLQQKENIIKEAKEKLNTQLAFTSSYQLNYQSAMSIIEEAKQILEKEVK